MSEIASPQLPRRDRKGHKGDFGKVNIISGSVGYTGAPCLAAAGALRAGAGLVSVGVPQAIYPIVAAKLLCAMPYPLPDTAGGLSLRAQGPILERCQGADAVVLGPGLGRERETGQLVRTLVKKLACPMVIDADGINALAGHIDALDSRRGHVAVLTPHAGEFARLLGREVDGDRKKEAGDFAARHGCVLVLKGHETVVACPDGKIYVNHTGNPGMASGGTGDVLSGMIAAFLGQGFAAETAATAGVYLHGRAGDLAARDLGEYAMTAKDLLDYLPRAMKEAEG